MAFSLQNKKLQIVTDTPQASDDATPKEFDQKYARFLLMKKVTLFHTQRKTREGSVLVPLDN